MPNVSLAQVYSYSDEKTEIAYFATATPKHTLVVQNARPLVTLTDTTGVARPDTKLGQFTISGLTQPGASNHMLKSGPAGSPRGTTVATDGTWEFGDIVTTVAGAAPVPITTTQGTPVYVTAADKLTLEASGNTRVGVVNYTAQPKKRAGVLPVKIGA